MNSVEKSRSVHLPNGTTRLMLALLFPLAACALQWVFPALVHPYVWLLFYPAVFFSSLLGGGRAGLLATATSTLLAWWFFSPSLISMIVFAGMGVLFSVTHERLSRINQRAAAALSEVNASRENLEEKIERRTADLARSIDALRESEAKYRLTLDSMLEGCQIIGFDWRYLYLNASAEKNNRRPNAELLGKTVLECWPGFAETEVFAAEKSCMEERSIQKLDVEFTFPDRQVGWYRVIIQPATEGIVVFSEDITERKQVERELKKQELMLRTVVEAMPVGVWIVDPKGTIVHGNKTGLSIWAGARYVGMEHYDEYKAWWADTGGRIRSEDWAAARAITKGETSLDEEIDIESFDGAHKTILHSAVPLWDSDQRLSGAVIVNQDITERKQAEQALKESEALFRRMFDLAPIGAAMVSLDYRFLMVNEVLCRITGYSGQELTARTFVDITHPDDIDLDVAQAQKLKTGEIDLYEMDKRYLRADGSTVWVHLNVRLIRDAQGKGLYYLPMIEDISERKRAEMALHEKQRQLEQFNLDLEQRIGAAVLESREKDRILMQQSRQAAMGEMIGNVAHQWRQPLNTLGLILQELLMTYGREEFNKESLQANVKKAMVVIAHMSKTIEDFRNYFKPEKEKVLFSVNQAVAKVLFLIESSLKSLDIKVDVVEKEQAEISGYANEYSQVLLNILLNCRDAFEGSQLESQRLITITVSMKDGRSVVTVADNAGGIPEAIVDNIFDPYFTTKGPDKGTGIGLYMAKTIIEKNMGGRLTVRNTPEGAEFRIEV
jgi:PAS domain S-box-containing protein